MKRRQVITAFGTLAIGTGTALGTGAFSATSSSSQASMSVATQEGDADLNILPGGDAGKSESNIKTGLYNNIPDLDNLPAAAVANSGYGMVNIQVYTTPQSSWTFDRIIKVVNNDNIGYNVGFLFTIVQNSADTNGVNKVYKFEDPYNSNQVISTVHELSNDSDGDLSGESFSGLGINSLSVGKGETKQVDLTFNASAVNLDLDPGNFNNNTSGSIGDQDSFNERPVTTQFVDKVTAVADEQ